jgi:hypothetical protein
MNGATGITDIHAEVRALRARVRADRRTVSLPLLVFGILTLVDSALLAVIATMPESGGAKLTLLLYWPVAGAAGLIVLRDHARRLAARAGVGGGPRSYEVVTVGFVVSLPVLALLFVPVFFVGGYWATLAWPAAILTAIALRQRDNIVYGVAVALALTGLVQGLLAATPRGSVESWTAIGLQVAAGVALILGGRMADRRARAV